jgi:hypothetical protein
MWSSPKTCRARWALCDWQSKQQLSTVVRPPFANGSMCSMVKKRFAEQRRPSASCEGALVTVPLAHRPLDFHGDMPRPRLRVAVLAWLARAREALRLSRDEQLQPKLEDR